MKKYHIAAVDGSLVEIDVHSRQRENVLTYWNRRNEKWAKQYRPYRIVEQP